MLNLRDNRLQLIFITLALVLIGFMFVYSAGSMQAIRLNKGDMYFLIKQMVGFFAGAVMLVIAYNIPLDFYRKCIAPLYFITLLLLVAVYFQTAYNGAHRWINMPVFSFQPSELAKFTIVVYLAHYMSKKIGNMASFLRGFLPAMIMIGFLLPLILFEPDYGTTFLIGLVVLTMFIVGGARIVHLLGCLFVMAPLAILILSVASYRKARIFSFLDPWADRFGSGYQLIQSLSAVGSGGLFGKGIGNSTQKLFFLPEAHTDFIYAIIAEELGFIGAIFVAILIVLFFRIVIKAALKHTDHYKKLLMIGLACLLFYQSIINIFVVLGMLPTKGITLPFISYGGSAMMLSLFFVGVILRGMEEAP